MGTLLALQSHSGALRRPHARLGGIRFTLAAVVAASLVLLSGCATRPAPKTEPAAAATGEKLYQAGNRWYLQGCYQEALRYYFGAYEYFSAGDRLAPSARALTSIGNLYRRLGDPAAALTFYNEALAIDRRLANAPDQAQTLINRAAAHLDIQQLERAAADLRQAEPLSADLPRLGHALARTRGILATRSGDLTQAERYLQEALETVAAASVLEEAATHYAIGKLHLTQGQPRLARPSFQRALALDRELGHTHGLADDLEALGECARRLEEWDVAAFYFQRSAKIFALLDHTDKTRALLETLQALAVEHPEAVNADLTLFFINRWIDGEQDADICP
ncbi:MAG: tetratricopeptide repeat protein [Desulfosarcinaceae bacterium]|nr:tetratricopeptide repeat protein [Desulfosarcinaceae bacterium]